MSNIGAIHRHITDFFFNYRLNALHKKILKRQAFATFKPRNGGTLRNQSPAKSGEVFLTT